MNERPRRNRKSASIRAIIRETEVNVNDLIYPLFLVDGKGVEVPIASMPGISRYSEDLMLRQIDECVAMGLKSFVIFPAVEDSLKDKEASYAMRSDNFYLQAIRAIKQRFGSMFDERCSHGSLQQ
jgi:porphobilinogen synthase